MNDKEKTKEQLISEQAKIEAIWITYSESPIPSLMLIRDGRIEEYNQAMFELTGYAHEEVPDIPAWMSKVYPDVEYRNKVIEISRQSRNRRIDIKRDVFNLKRKNGEERFVEFSVFDITLQGKPIGKQIVQGQDITERIQMEQELRKHQDNLEKLVEMRTANLEKANRKLQDKMTERKKSERALRESEEKYSEIFEGVEEGILYYSKKGDVIDVNPALLKITGLLKSDIVGKHISSLAEIFVSIKDIPRILSTIKAALLGESTNAYEVEYSNRIFEIGSHKPQKDASGNIFRPPKSTL